MIFLWSDFTAAQPLNKFALGKDLDLESINFAFDSDEAIEDLKQLDRLTNFMNQDMDLKLEISAHTDSNGPKAYNQDLSKRRAEAVKKALIDKGLSPDRIIMKANASQAPFATNATREGQLLNRRVDFSIFKIENGERDYYYQDNRFVKPLETLVAMESQEKDADKGNDIDEVLDRLDHLERLLKEKAAASTPLTDGAPASGGSTSFNLFSNNVFSLSGGIGSRDGDLMGNIEGLLFLPVHDGSFALQGGFNGDLSEDLQAYQMDAGLVGRSGRFQFGAFASMKWVTLDLYDDTAALSQIHVGGSYLLDRGKVGLFFTQAMDGEDVVKRQSHYVYGDLHTTETYLEVSDKIGIDVEYLFDNGLFLHGDVGSLDADESDIFGSLRLSYPITQSGDLRIFCQGDYNNGYLEDDDNYTALIGIELTTPYTAGRVGTTDQGVPKIRPMTVQPIAYEMKTRTSVLLSDINHAPTVSIKTSRIQGGSPLTVQFTGVASDPDGTVTSYAWNFGDGESGSGDEISHTFSGSGLYNVTLTVTDNKGKVSSASTLVDVTNAPPQVTITTTKLQGGAPHTVTFTATASDSDGEILSYAWHFGDGKTATGESVTHTFNAPGTYQVTLNVTDNHYVVTTTSVTVTATNYPPTLYLNYAFSETDPSTVTFSANGFDPDGTIGAFTWNFGDGTRFVVDNPAVHTYDAPGVYTVSVSAVDSQGVTTKETITVNIP